MIRNPSRRVRGRVAAVAVLAVVAGLVAAGCGPVKAGAAALVGDRRIAVEELAQSVQATEQAATRGGGLRLSDRSALVRLVLSRQITAAVIDEAAQRKGITVSSRAVNLRISQLGGRSSLESLLARRAVPPEELRGYVRRQVIAERLVRSLGAGGDVRAQQAALLDYLRRLARDVGVTVSPRYGRFDAQQLAVAPDKSSLSTPDTDAAGAPGLGGLRPPPSGG